MIQMPVLKPKEPIQPMPAAQCRAKCEIAPAMAPPCAVPSAVDATFVFVEHPIVPSALCPSPFFARNGIRADRVPRDLRFVRGLTRRDDQEVPHVADGRPGHADRADLAEGLGEVRLPCLRAEGADV